MPAVGRLAAEIQAAIRQLVFAALGPDVSAQTVDGVDALLDFRTWQALNDRGFSQDAATNFAVTLTSKALFAGS
jgi:hypothetical protein